MRRVLASIAVVIVVAVFTMIIVGDDPTMGPAAGSLVVSAASTTSTLPPDPAPAGFRTVTYRGVSVVVPATWPSVDAIHAGRCHQPFREMPAVYIGHAEGAPRCPAPMHIEERDGVWLEAAADGTWDTAPSWADLAADQLGLPIAAFGYHGVRIQLGLRGDRAAAKAVFDSLAFDATQADSPVEGVCPPAVGAMPEPERLVSRLELWDEKVLDPPRPDDVARIPAEQVWQEHHVPARGGLYRLVLGRLSAPRPSSLNADGTETPFLNDVLVWAILRTPLHTTFGDCGFHGLRAVNAHTGQAVAGSGHSLS